MFRTEDVDGVLITGVYGTGKSSVAAEIAETLEVATEWLAGAIGVGIEDLVMTNEGPDIDDLAARIIRWLGWDD
jgi:Holliday junction resolvasome RuvABC ATP-dependent DNA helicase subunit